MRRPMQLVALLCCVFAAVKAKSYYTISGPEVIRPYSDYNVAVSTSGILTPVNITIQVDGKMDNGDEMTVSEQRKVEPHGPKIFKLKIGNVTPGQYRLTAFGHSGLIFQNSTYLQFEGKSLSIFIQTDHAVYKPGAKVQFHCIVLDSRMKPVQNRPLDIDVTDGGGTKIKQWSKKTTSNGIFSGEFDLSEFPVLGDWKIVATVANQTFEKGFEVAEYVLPIFEVSVDAPVYVSFDDVKITATIHAEYTNGIPVKGEATITGYGNSLNGGDGEARFLTSLTKVVPIDGEVTIDYDIINELGFVYREIYESTELPIKLEVSVEDAVTGRRQNHTINMYLRRYSYTINLIRNSDHYKPGFKFTAYIKIEKYDGTPVRDTDTPITVSHGFGFEERFYKNATLDENGMIKMEIHPPIASNDSAISANFVKSLRIIVKYGNHEKWLPYTNDAKSPSNSFILATLKTEEPTVNEDVEIEINSTSPLKYINYEILGRGDIISVGSIQVADSRMTSFKFLATYEMAPIARVVAYYTRDDGEVVADILDVELSGILQNFVNVDIDPDEIAPGGTVDLTITSSPNSSIGLLAIDQRSLLLKSENDISYEDVFSEIQAYDTAEDSRYGVDSPDSILASASSTAQDLFDDSGIVVMTNGYVHSLYTPDLSEDTISIGRISVALPSFDPPTPKTPAPKPKIRKRFPETWIWQILDVGDKGETTLRRKVPHSMTSWVITAFSVHPDQGLGLIEEPKQLKVFKPFFMSVDLPYSVMRGETIAVQITIFDYLDKDVEAEVTLENSGQFEFAESSHGAKGDSSKPELFRKKTIHVRANDRTSVSFMITPRELGFISIKAKATSKLGGDSVEHKLLVKAEGETQNGKKAVFVDLRNTTRVETNITIDIPKNIVPRSEYIEISAVGDIIGPSLPNLEDLIHMPSGNGEENMVKIVPNVVVLNYFKKTNQLTQEAQKKMVENLETGYKQELTYRHKDGSFSASGMSDPSGSTWLTAFVARFLKQAADYITVENRLIEEALTWLSNNQAPDGSFPEVGKIENPFMQGGSGKGLALTAYILTAFLENSDLSEKYRNTINKGVDYIAKNLEGLDDLYALSLSTYVLNLAKHPHLETALNRLDERAWTKDDEKWWSNSPPTNDTWFHLMTRLAEIEMTSYALMTYLDRNRVTDAIPIMKWLVINRDTPAVFTSVQDTFVAIKALAKFAEKFVSHDNNITINFMYEGGGQSNVNINAENNLVLQKHVVPRNARLVKVTATGKGSAIIQVSSHYNLNMPEAHPLFTLDPRIDEKSKPNHLRLSICTSFLGTIETGESNVTVMEVNLPSGFTVDTDSLSSLEASEYVKSVKTKNGDTMVVLYLDRMGREKYCPTISAFTSHVVEKSKPVPVSIYDYYDPSKRTTVFYEPRVPQACEICKDTENCEKMCEGISEKRNATSDSTTTMISA